MPKKCEEIRNYMYFTWCGMAWRSSVHLISYHRRRRSESESKSKIAAEKKGKTSNRIFIFISSAFPLTSGKAQKAKAISNLSIQSSSVALW